MKYLPIFSLFITTHILAQPIDCQEIEKLKSAQAAKNTSRTFSALSTEYSDMETITEMDTSKQKRMRTLTTTVYKIGPRAGKTEIREAVFIDRIYYSKSNTEDFWTYSALPAHDTTKPSQFVGVKPRYENCHKVGTETIDGQIYDIIETTTFMNMKSSLDSVMLMKIWVNWASHSTKKMEMTTRTNKGKPMKLTTEYGVAIKPIEKPENAQARKAQTLPISNMGKTAKMPVKLNSDDFPYYKKGVPSLFSFINAHLVYPKAARDAKIEGTVYVGFTVETDGTICDLIVKRGIGYGCDEAALELVKKTSGNWMPAVPSGIPSRAPYTLPIKFKL